MSALSEWSITFICRAGTEYHPLWKRANTQVRPYRIELCIRIAPERGNDGPIKDVYNDEAEAPGYMLMHLRCSGNAKIGKLFRPDS